MPAPALLPSPAPPKEWSRWIFAPRAGQDDRIAWAVALLNVTLALLLLAAFFAFAFSQLEYNWNWAPVWRYRARFFQGFGTTIWISLASLVLSTLIGLIGALASRSKFLPLRFAAKTCIEVVRGTPLLVQILIFFYVVASALHVDNRYVVGVLVLSLFTGAYIAEVIRAGIEGVGKSQLESARAIGLTTNQTYRLVIFPQAIRQILPPLAGQFVSLIKDSSLLSVISVGEFAKNAQEVNSITYSTLECYLPLAIGYLILTLPISLWTRWLEGRNRFDT